MKSNAFSLFGRASIHLKITIRGEGGRLYVDPCC
jgi:hypothetical protein